MKVGDLVRILSDSHGITVWISNAVDDPDDNFVYVGPDLLGMILDVKTFHVVENGTTYETGYHIVTSSGITGWFSSYDCEPL